MYLPGVGTEHFTVASRFSYKYFFKKDIKAVKEKAQPSIYVPLPRCVTQPVATELFPQRGGGTQVTVPHANLWRKKNPFPPQKIASIMSFAQPQGMGTGPQRARWESPTCVWNGPSSLGTGPPFVKKQEQTLFKDLRH